MSLNEETYQREWEKASIEAEIKAGIMKYKVGDKIIFTKGEKTKVATIEKIENGAYWCFAFPQWFLVGEEQVVKVLKGE